MILKVLFAVFLIALTLFFVIEPILEFLGRIFKKRSRSIEEEPPQSSLSRPSTQERNAFSPSSPSERNNTNRPSAPGILRYGNVDFGTTDNHISRMSPEQRKKLLGCNIKTSSSERRALSERNLSLYLRSPARHRSLSGGDSSGVNYRELGFSSPVTDQGSCGSCVAHGCTNAGAATVKKSENNPNLDIRLSAADLFFCKASQSGYGCDTGWYVDEGLAAMQDGLVSEDEYPYDTRNQSCPIRGSNSYLMKVTSFEQIFTIEAAQKWLQERGAIATSFAVYSDFMRYSGGVYRVTSGTLEGYHCVDIEGFDVSLNAWYCKNSWSTGWGENGYFWIGFGEAEIDAEMFGISGYQLSKKAYQQRSLANRHQTRKADKPSCPGCRGRIL